MKIKFSKDNHLHKIAPDVHIFKNYQKNSPEAQTTVRNNEKIINSITEYYNILSSTHIEYEVSLNNCFAVRLAKLIINIIKNDNYLMKGSLSDEFYLFASLQLKKTDQANEIEDNDLIVIYLKQCVNILRSSAILKAKNDVAVIIEDDYNDLTLFTILFDSFWNSTPWENIFPSDTEAALFLHSQRNILTDTLLRHFKKIKLNNFANEFFELTGFSYKNDLIMISFLDFYFLTWLKHFGIINYTGSMNRPVCIELTQSGRKVLESIIA